MRGVAKRKGARPRRAKLGGGRPEMARLETRIRTDQKRLIERAAALRGVTLTDFVIGTVHEAAARALNEHEVMFLGLADRARFVEALLHPPAPSPSLRRAVERHKRTVESK